MKYKFKSNTHHFYYMSCIFIWFICGESCRTKHKGVGRVSCSQLLNTYYLPNTEVSTSHRIIYCILTRTSYGRYHISMLHKIQLSFHKLNNLLRSSRLGTEVQIYLTPEPILGHKPCSNIQIWKTTDINHTDPNVEENILYIALNPVNDTW